MAYDIANDQWLITCSQMVVPNKWEPGCAMDSQSERLFVFGGYLDTNPSSTYLDNIEEYNMSANNWRLLLNVTLYEPVYRVSCILFSSFDNCIYCVGGRSKTSGSVSTVQIFDPMTLTIDSAKYELTLSRRDVRLVINGRCLLFLGGDYTATGRTNLIEYLCAPPIPTPAPIQCMFTYGSLFFSSLHIDVILFQIIILENSLFFS